MPGGRGLNKNIPGQPTRAMVLAAGLGTRLRPVTDKLPKALVAVDRRPLVDHALDRLEAAGLTDVVVNTHYLAAQVAAHLAGRSSPTLHLSHEEEILETGGGVAKALPHLGDGPFFVVNVDALWLNGPLDTLGRLAGTWNDNEMDGLLMLHSTVDAYGYHGVGDFCAEGDGRLTRRPEGEVSPWLFTGIQILHPRLFKDAPGGAFSLNVLYDRAIEAGRLYGMIHDGEWFHVGTPDGLEEAESFMRLRYAGIKRR